MSSPRCDAVSACVAPPKFTLVSKKPESTQLLPLSDAAPPPLTSSRPTPPNCFTRSTAPVNVLKRATKKMSRPPADVSVEPLNVAVCSNQPAPYIVLPGPRALARNLSSPGPVIIYTHSAPPFAYAPM